MQQKGNLRLAAGFIEFSVRFDNHWITWMLVFQPECYLVQCREQIMEEEVAVTMFDTDKYAPALKQGRETDHRFLSHLWLCCVFCYWYGDDRMR